jgi:hypothetical protein
METKREFTAVTTQSLAKIPITKLIEELRLQGIRRKALEQQVAMLWRLANNYAHKALDGKEEAKVKIIELKENLDNRMDELYKANRKIAKMGRKVTI